jgi:hypothetical protein
MTNITFLTARMARDKSRNNIMLHSEIRELESQILQAIDNGYYECIVFSTAMTLDEEYWKVLNNLVEDRVRSEHIKLVLAYFTNLGYTIFARTNLSQPTNFEWVIKW